MGRSGGFSEYRYASAYFTGSSIVVDKRRSGYPCRADLTCRFISTETAGRDAHELATHQIKYEIPTSPNATAGFAPVVAYRARVRRAAH